MAPRTPPYPKGRRKASVLSMGKKASVASMGQERLEMRMKFFHWLAVKRWEKLGGDEEKERKWWRQGIRWMKRVKGESDEAVKGKKSGDGKKGMLKLKQEREAMLRDIVKRL
jgi:hypothetical protein